MNCEATSCACGTGIILQCFILWNKRLLLVLWSAEREVKGEKVGDANELAHQRSFYVERESSRLPAIALFNAREVIDRLPAQGTSIRRHPLVRPCKHHGWLVLPHYSNDFDSFLSNCLRASETSWPE